MTIARYTPPKRRHPLGDAIDRVLKHRWKVEKDGRTLALKPIARPPQRTGSQERLERFSYRRELSVDQ